MLNLWHQLNFYSDTLAVSCSRIFHLLPHLFLHSDLNFSFSSGVILPIFSCIFILHCSIFALLPPRKPPNNILLNNAYVNVITLMPNTAGNMAFHKPITTKPSNNTKAINRVININPFFIHNFFIVYNFCMPGCI